MRFLFKFIIITIVIQLNLFGVGEIRACFPSDAAEGKNHSIGIDPAVANKSDKKKPIRLIAPPFKKQINSLTPTFSWRPLSSDTIEYRILISKANGKIVLDKWINNKTAYTISSQNPLEDLTAYYWMVYGYKNDKFVESPVWSFWVDQNMVTDLEVSNIEVINNRADWQPGDIIKINAKVYNRGTTDASLSFVTLYNGILNENYFNKNALRKTAVLNSVTINSLKANDSKSIFISAKLPYGYNNLSLYIAPGKHLGEMYYPNNSKHVIKIQTEDKIVSINGLFVIYSSYRDPETGKQILNQDDVNQIYQNIDELQKFVWDHTLLLQINSNTQIIDRLLEDKNFAYQDDQWGYLLTEQEIQSDLKRLQIHETDYDFIFVFYSWYNSPSSWSGYSGYTYNQSKIPISAQPVYHGKNIDKTITIHEFLHLLEYFFDKSGEQKFYSPHDRTQITTFSDDLQYFQWILETLPTNKWLLLKQGQISKRTGLNKNQDEMKSASSPEKFELLQNYPNPFNSATTISYKISNEPGASSATKVSLIIYDLLGNQIKTLVNEFQPPGHYFVRWDGRDKNGNEISSSIYFYELRAGDQRQLKKLAYIQ